MTSFGRQCVLTSWVLTASRSLFSDPMGSTTWEQVELGALGSQDLLQ